MERLLAELPVLAVMVPLAGAVLCLVLPRYTRGLSILTGLVTVAAVVALAGQSMAGAAEAQLLGGWSPPLGIRLAPDGLGVALTLLAALLMFVCLLFTGDNLRSSSHAAAWLFTWASLGVVFLSDDLFNIYVGLEMLGIGAVALVIRRDSAAAVNAALDYLLAGLLGSLLFLLGVALVYASAGSLVPDAIGRMEHEWTRLAAVALMGAGVLVKAAIFPGHGWLPHAHGAAAPAASAVLSGVVVKAGVYLLWLLWASTPAGSGTEAAALGVGALGTAAIAFGSFMALRARRLKLVVAYSTVSQVGYLALALPLMALDPVMGLAGAMLMLGSHALAKAGCFLAVGSVLAREGHDRIAELGGLASRAPIATFALAAGGVCLVGLPPTGGFVGKWTLLEVSAMADAWHWLVVLLGGSALSAMVFTRALASTFLRASASDADPPTVADNPPAAWVALGLVLGAVALGPLAGDWTTLALGGRE